MHASGLKAYVELNTEEEERDIEGYIYVAFRKYHASSCQATVEALSKCPQCDNTLELTWLPEGHGFSQIEKKICWICREEFDSKVSLMERYVNNREFIENLE